MNKEEQKSFLLEITNSLEKTIDSKFTVIKTELENVMDVKFSKIEESIDNKFVKIEESIDSKFSAMKSDFEIIIDDKMQQMHTSFMVVNEYTQDKICLLSENISFLGEKIDKVEIRMDNLENRFSKQESELFFIKGYLSDNLDPRVTVLETPYYTK